MAAHSLCLLASLSALFIGGAAPLPSAVLDQDALWDGRVSLVQVQKAAVANLVLQPAPDPEVNCSAAPKMCSAPFNCDSPDTTSEEPATKDLHVNLRGWCYVPGLFESIDACVSGDLEEYSRLAFAEQSRSRGVSIVDIDSQYCFLAGHCDFEGPIGRTLEEMESMCDARFGGRGRWTTGIFFENLTDVMLSGALDGSIHAKLFHLKHGLKFKVNGRFADHFARLACSMGNYHCDLVYCKENYCNNPHWRARYAHLSPKRARAAEQASG